MNAIRYGKANAARICARRRYIVAWRAARDPAAHAAGRPSGL